MNKITLKQSLFTLAIILVSILAFANIALANDYHIPCPFYPQANRTIVNFDTDLVWGKAGYPTQVFRSVNLPAGNYKVSLSAFDGYEDRTSTSQPNESYFVQFKNGLDLVAQSNPTPDLQDNVKNAVFTGVVNNSINVSKPINTIVANHSNYLNNMGGRNSVTAGCAAFDLITPPPPVDQTLTASCSVNPGSINVGGYLNWSATASGGNGSYNYSWTGTDGLYGNSSTVSKSYPNAGTKTGTVTVTSGSQSVTKSCTGSVTEIIVDNNLNVYCDADESTVDVDEDVRWTANVSGGNGNYSYDWNGDDGLYGSSRSVTWSYDDDGTKDASVRVTSGNQTKTANCSVRVREENDDLRVSCYANPSNPQVGQRMNWYANVSGGDGDYDYEWEGDDDLDSSSRSPSMTYRTSGRKEATVTVRDGDGNRAERTCSANVSQNSVLAFSQYNQTPYQSAVYLSQVPYTGPADNFKLAFFIIGLALFSAWIASIVISYKKSVGEMD